MAILYAGTGIADVHGTSGSSDTTAANLADGAQEGISVAQEGVGAVIELESGQSTLYGCMHFNHTGANIEDVGTSSNTRNWYLRFFNQSYSLTNALFQLRRYTSGSQYFLRAEYWDGAAYQAVDTDYEIALPTQNQVYRFDWQIVMNGSAGIVRFWYDNVLTHELTGFNTVQTAATNLDRVSIHNPINLSNTTTFSNFILATEDTRDLICVGLYPDGNGADTDWVGTYQDIDEFGLGADFVSSNAAGESELWTQESIPAAYSGQRLRAVVMSTRSRAGSSGPQNMRAQMRIAGVTYDGGVDMPLSGAMRPVQHVWETDPSTGTTWSQATLDAAQYGLISKT